MEKHASESGIYTLAVVRQPSDSVARHPAVDWAIGHLAETCSRQGISVAELQQMDGLPAQSLCLLIAGPDSGHPAAHKQGADAPSEPESFSLCWQQAEQRRILTAAGSDARGLVYAILELADIVKYAQDPYGALSLIEPSVEKPASPIRSINRLFVSEVEDKPWFYDRTFWLEYLTELATHRFNRLHLALGMGYDYGHDPGVQDNYFCFAYPYLLSLPGYSVKVKGLPAGEAERNLDMLRFISQEAKRRGMHFQLGIWTHAYDPSESPNANYIIEGVNRDNHAAYCRDALRSLLELCPDIDGVTIRTHYEGGIPEPAHEFWNVVFSGITQVGRRVEIDLHAKGVDDQMLQVAIDTGMPIVVSPKYWAEHMGPPYHQAAIRPSEFPVAATERPDLMSITATYRKFTRYGYADFLKEDRQYDVLYRIWPGTQRVLLWGDPAMAAGYGRFGSFGGGAGVELCEPLTFKGRKGSGSAGGREPYSDTSLGLAGKEWKKYLFSYRLWGRLLYNPDADPSSWRRYLSAEFGAGAAACEEALANASRILPLVTAAHLPSAANNHYWPEMYTNMPIAKTAAPLAQYAETPQPKTFGAVSPLDPAMFYRIDDFVEDLLRGERCGKYSPLDVAERLTGWAATAERSLAEAASRVADPESPSFRRFRADVRAQAGLGHFFADKLRAGVAYALFARTGHTDRLQDALQSYRSAEQAWERVVESTQGVYREDITFGYVPYMRGHWADRLPSIREDIARLEQELTNARTVGSHTEKETASAGASVQTAADRPAVEHEPPQFFRKREPLKLSVSVPAPAAGWSIELHYRHVNQVESYNRLGMVRAADRYEATIPESYTDTRYPLMYFFELRDGSGNAWLAPGFNETFSNQPYYVVRQGG